MPWMTFSNLRQTSPHIGRFATGLMECETLFAINSRLRVAHFLAQLWVESAGFTRTSENLRYSTASQLHKAINRISIKEAKELTSASDDDVKWSQILLQGDGILIRALREDRPSQARDMSRELEIKAYGGPGRKGAGLMQITSTDNGNTKSELLTALCRLYRKKTDAGKETSLRFLEDVQGLPANGVLDPAVVSLANRCDSVAQFVTSFDKMMQADPYVAAISAGGYWYGKQDGDGTCLNDLADLGDDDDSVDAIGAVINGKNPPNDYAKRRAQFHRIYGFLREGPREGIESALRSKQSYA